MSIVKSLSVGNGDMFYIKHAADSFSIIDCCLNENNREDIVDELEAKSNNKGIKRFISTHPDDDHIRGLHYLNQKMDIINFYCVKNEARKEDETYDFKEYCSLRDSEKSFYLEKDCSRKWLNEADSERGPAGIHILWPVINNEYYTEALEQIKEGGSPNNISPIIKYSLEDGAKILWMGDLETEFMKKIKDDVILEEIDILFAPHHGRESGKLPKNWLDNLNPKSIVIGEAPSQHIHYYQDFPTIKQNSSGDLLFECVSKQVHIYCRSSYYKESFLVDEQKSNNYGLYYLGTLNL